jgi:hypothetical protein
VVQPVSGGLVLAVPESLFLNRVLDESGLGLADLWGERQVENQVKNVVKDKACKKTLN